MGKKPFTIIAAIIFLVAALLHLLRLFHNFQIILGSHLLPHWLSIAGALIAGLLSWGLFREARR